MNKLSLPLLSMLISTTSLALAAQPSITPKVSADGNLQYIQVEINQTRFRVNAIGKLINVATAQQHNIKFLGITSPTTPPNVRHIQPINANAPALNRLSINSVPVEFYTCGTNSLTPNSQLTTVPTSSLNALQTPAYQQQLNKLYAAIGCINQHNRSGPVKRIGHFYFTYYSNQPSTGISSFDPSSGNYGKINTAGPYHFTYYPLNAFENKGGKVRYMLNAGSYK